MAYFFKLEKLENENICYQNYFGCQFDLHRVMNGFPTRSLIAVFTVNNSSRWYVVISWYIVNSVVWCMKL